MSPAHVHHVYVQHRVEIGPRCWQAAAEAIRDAGDRRIGAAQGALYGVWRNQIGRPRDELTAITAWSDAASGAAGAERALLTGLADVRACESVAMTPTLRSEEHTSELQSLMSISYAVF